MTKFQPNLLILGFIVVYANAQCLKDITLTATRCSYDALLIAFQEKLDSDPLCSNKDATLELQSFFGSVDEAKVKISEACSAANIPFSAITDQGDIFDKEYYDGGTYYNEERESINEYGITENRLKNDPGARIIDIYKSLASNQGLSWPNSISNFEDKCKLNAAMCCFTQDRQANDNNGNCATPYEENCIDASPADNTDICYVDMERAPTSSRTSQGFAIFEKNAEEDSHCHGFAWAEDPTDSSARFSANNLFYVSMYDHLTARGYARNVPGAPMCACVEQMPVVTRADCTQIDIQSETAEFSLRTEKGVTNLTATISDLKIAFNSCQGANNNNNDLTAYYERLVDEGKISTEKQVDFQKTVVGRTYCYEAIDSFLNEKGLTPKPECRFSYPQECGCETVLQNDYRGVRNVTKSGLQCQRWDEQAPQKHSRTRKNFPESNLIENYCRNPDDETGGAWCYTTDPNKRWEYCDIPNCTGDLETSAPTQSPTTEEEAYPCSYDVDQADYRGRINETAEGIKCQSWSSQYPHTHSRTSARYPDSGLDGNYCRNPDSEPGAWCYTTDPNIRWKLCDVPRCDDSTERRKRQLRGE
uniref:Kringle domain-containing protein n=1 Tax=Corethron hystrix TaxID=216773 RepID=A0A7S1G0X7_9STRA|mmetsp:Transcript_49/g.110  ORF Transcript_49/g.110 Transcript_49/m.110 type:complete len:589 (+) Transcript_49:41-1807(+)